MLTFSSRDSSYSVLMVLVLGAALILALGWFGIGAASASSSAAAGSAPSQFLAGITLAPEVTAADAAMVAASGILTEDDATRLSRLEEVPLWFLEALLKHAERQGLVTLVTGEIDGVGPGWISLDQRVMPVSDNAEIFQNGRPVASLQAIRPVTDTDRQDARVLLDASGNVLVVSAYYEVIEGIVTEVLPTGLVLDLWITDPAGVALSWPEDTAPPIIVNGMVVVGPERLTVGDSALVVLGYRGRVKAIYSYHYDIYGLIEAVLEPDEGTPGAVVVRYYTTESSAGTPSASPIRETLILDEGLRVLKMGAMAGATDLREGDYVVIAFSPGTRTVAYIEVVGF